MSVIFALIGAVIGIVAAVSNDFSMGFGALVGGMAGAALARLLQKQSARPVSDPVSKPAASDNLNYPAGSPSSELAARVERLEQEIVVLRGEIRALRAGVIGASAAGSADDESTLSGRRPDTLASHPYAIPPAAGQQPPRERAVTPPQPAAVRPTGSTSAVTPLEPAAAPASSGPAVAGTLNGQPHNPAALSPSTDSPIPAQTPPAPPSPPAPPRGPGLLQRLFKSARDWLFGGNTVVRVGIVVRGRGLEPLHPCGRQDLNLVRLPISPPSQPAV